MVTGDGIHGLWWQHGRLLVQVAVGVAVIAGDGGDKMMGDVI